MELCPRCGTELGQEWDPSELCRFVFTELTEEHAKFVATLTADSTAEEILAAVQCNGCFALENLTPRQVEAYAEFLKQEEIPFVKESEEQKAVRLQKQLEAETEKARLAAITAQAEAEAEKARLAAITAQAEAEARAKAQTELEKFKMEFQAKQAQKRKRFGLLFAVMAIPSIIIIVLFIDFLADIAAGKKKAVAVADLKVMLRNDPFMTYEFYRMANPDKLTLAEYDAVYQQEDYAEARKKLAWERAIKGIGQVSGWQVGKAEFCTISDGIVLELMPCPEGSFTMGSPSDEEERFSDEKQHLVTLTEPFLIGKYEVTQAQYKAVMGKNPSYFPSPDRPVEKVTWVEAMAFCDKLNDITKGKRPAGYCFTLPAEVQWEYACRAGTTTALNNGRNMVIKGKYGNAPALDKVGWYSQNCEQNFECPKSFVNTRGGTHPVGRKAPNAWGIYDMHGNVCEWCLDGFGISGTRIFRGGSWHSHARFCRAASRVITGGSYYQNYALGFRVVLSAVQSTKAVETVFPKGSYFIPRGWKQQ